MKIPDCNVTYLNLLHLKILESSLARSFTYLHGYLFGDDKDKCWKEYSFQLLCRETGRNFYTSWPQWCHPRI